MKQTVRSFMASLVDYAGLFPPAGLDMAPAVKEYGRWLADPAAWMLGRFIVPAGRLPELDGVLAETGITGTRLYSVLAGSREGVDESLSVLKKQGALVRDFEARQAGSAGIEILELPLPAQVCSETPALQAYLAEMLAKVVAAGFDVQTAYLEIPPAADPDLVVAAIVRAALDYREASGGQTESQPRLAAKLRTGGETSEEFPEPERVAGVLAACARYELALKCTAGLHHPVRHRAELPPVMMHGFLNVFGAGMLAHDGLAGADLVACVAETDPAAFEFSSQGFAWRNHELSGDRITELRRYLHGFGSCSFAEPVADLQEMGLI